MSDNNTILAELLPSSNVVTLLCTIDSNVAAAGTIFCMNQNIVDDRISVALVPNGQVLLSNSYIAYNTLIYSGQSLYLQQIYLNSGDSIYVNSQNGTSNFIFNGTTDPNTI
jgi:hypothetical protein